MKSRADHERDLESKGDIVLQRGRGMKPAINSCDISLFQSCCAPSTGNDIGKVRPTPKWL